jgi:hypothetical protein
MKHYLVQIDIIQNELNKLKELIAVEMNKGDESQILPLVIAALNSDHPLVKHVDLFDTTLLFLVCHESYPDHKYFANTSNLKKFQYVLRQIPTVSTFRLNGYVAGKTNLTLWCVRNRDRYDNLSREELYERYQIQQEMGSAEYRKRRIETMSTSFL